jgi:hypothetical protein
MYRAHRYGPVTKSSSSRQFDPRLDCVALLLIIVDFLLLGYFAWEVAEVEAASGSLNRVIIFLTLFCTLPSLLGMAMAWYMRGKPYVFALPLFFVSVMVAPGINYACASLGAKHLLIYTQMEYQSRRNYGPVSIHVYLGAKDAVEPLVRILQDHDSKYRRDAVVDLGIIGPAAAEAVPNLLQVLRERNRDASYQAAQSLVKIGGTGIDALIQALTDDEDRVRLTAIVALQNAGAAGLPALPALEKDWPHEDPTVRYQIDLAAQNIHRASGQ